MNTGMIFPAIATQVLPENFAKLKLMTVKVWFATTKALVLMEEIVLHVIVELVSVGNFVRAESAIVEIWFVNMAEFVKVWMELRFVAVELVTHIRLGGISIEGHFCFMDKRQGFENQVKFWTDNRHRNLENYQT